MNSDENKSEVARLRERIEQEYRAAELAMNGFALGVSRHDFITAKMERVGECHQQLTRLIGGDAATQILVDIIDGTGAASPAGKQAKEA